MRSRRLLFLKGFEVAEPDQLVAVFIPQTEGKRFQARPKCNCLHFLEHRIRIVAPFQVIIGNPRAEMMNMMEPDVSREPLQHFGQFIKGTALYGNGQITPIVVPLPVDPFILMLHIK